ncbi:MAG: hypothetical protein UX09_C0046G0017 [Candidatus Uhrbacteria bacterium GW2011_GWE2_45_35]|uniref:Uncharacterized protein n=2 Tax=Candidatus Uhriibacteriota TaxID=1752732 RepID=A0A0G1JG05_9BACT|nr:MAG: hypothetical protein UW63_C0031G0008 [Candidatus Uhrbacteria bacterium GW2011_GWF2_44_350]KKU06655.1 MAG: hypothetical protein UX09_C0046G0017 [Candidatus Uhrbacteria bacterium GW2011_GWE2_45_35]HBR80697.1 hypothetical protein [Candidatus Uhrbacteria bacterium]HCU31659.1 hypothetical protein [Candidatus Uhrbacteria bacterium]
MFKHLHHRTWFPAVVVGLSLFLVIFIVWAYLAKQNLSDLEATNGPTITSEQYQNELLVLVGDFWIQYQGQVDDAARLLFVSDLEQNLLALKVPSENRSVHFELVSSLELLRQGLVGNSEKMASGLVRLEKTFNDNPWLNVE